MDKIKQKGKDIIKNPFSFLLFSILYLELLIRIKIFSHISLSFLYIILFSISLSFLLMMLCEIFTKSTQQIILSVLLFLLGLYFCSQILYYDYFKVFLTIYSIGNGTQVAEFYKDIIDLIIRHIPWIFLCFLPLLIYIFFLRKRIHFPKKHKKQLIYQLILCIGLFMVSYLSLYYPTQETTTALDVYQEASINEVSVEKLGLLRSLKLDISSFLFGQNEETDLEETTAQFIPIEIQYDDQVMDIDFDALIKTTKDEKLKNMHRYFQNCQPTKKNQYTGMFKGYNLILMTCEGFSPYAINKEVTPTLYKLSHEGFVFKNFYTPLWNVSTSDGEYVALQGLVPKSGTWSFKASAHNDLPLTLGRQFEKMGYATKAYHNHSYKYYGRHLSHPNLGYDYKGVGNGLKVTKQWPESDLEMMNVTVQDYIHEEHFHTYYMTVSGHTNYTFSGNSMASKNKKYVKDLNYSDLAKGYLATQIELDKALEKLLNELKKANQDQKTLIVMSADHYPYGLPYENYCELAGHKLDKDFEIYKNELIIWSASMKEPIVVDKLGCSIDILPTVSNLLGLEYDSRLLMGTDLLSDSEPLVMFANKSFMTDKVKYNSCTDEVTWLNGKEDQDYLKKMLKTVKQKFQYSSLILDKNYYNYIKERE